MALKVTVKSSDYDLTTTAALKEYLGLTGTSDDARLSACIRAASRWAESYIGYPLSAQGYRETRPTFGTRNLMLTQTPVRAVTQLLDSQDTGEAGSVGTSDYVLNGDAGMLEREDGWMWTVPIDGDLSQTPRSGQEQRPWLVDYVGGWTRGGIDTGSPLWSTEGGSTDTGRTLPEDIEEAVKQKASVLFDGTESLDRERLGDLDIVYNLRSGTADKQTPYETLLGSYRRLL